MRVRAIAAAFIALLAVSADANAVETIVLTAHKASADSMAWQVFTQMMAPAGKGVRYEGWASDSDIYGGTPQWPAPGGMKALQRSVGGAASTKTHLMMVSAPSACVKPVDGAAGNFPASACIGEEVRHNRPVYDYLVKNGLTSTAGLVKAYAGTEIMLPPDSVIAKADWVPVTDIVKWLPQYKTADQVRAAYYTNSASEGGLTTEYALVGVSIQSRSSPNWLWMTFEHRSNPGRCDVIGCHDDFGALRKDVAPAHAANGDYGPCAKSPALLAAFGKAGLAPVWNNYCLKGTQTRYVDPRGVATKLGNSVIERMNHGIPIAHISCITCHAYASFDAAGHPNGKILPLAPVGAVDAKLLKGYARDDFVWGLLLAK